MCSRLRKGVVMISADRRSLFESCFLSNCPMRGGIELICTCINFEPVKVLTFEFLFYRCHQSPNHKVNILCRMGIRRVENSKHEKDWDAVDSTNGKQQWNKRAKVVKNIFIHMSHWEDCVFCSMGMSSAQNCFINEAKVLLNKYGGWFLLNCEHFRKCEKKLEPNQTMLIGVVQIDTIDTSK